MIRQYLNRQHAGYVIDWFRDLWANDIKGYWMAIDICTCGCEDREKPKRCPRCGADEVFTSWAPSIRGQGYGHKTFECDSNSCGWWDG